MKVAVQILILTIDHRYVRLNQISLDSCKISYKHSTWTRLAGKKKKKTVIYPKTFLAKGKIDPSTYFLPVQFFILTKMGSQPVDNRPADPVGHWDRPRWGKRFVFKRKMKKNLCPGVTKECFLEAFEYLKTSKKHPFVTPAPSF